MKEIKQATHVVRYFGNYAHPRGIVWYVRDMDDHYCTVDHQHISLKKNQCQILQIFDSPITNMKIRVIGPKESSQLQTYLFMRGVGWYHLTQPQLIAHVHKQLLFVNGIGALDYISTESVFNGVCVPEYKFQTDHIGLPSLTLVEPGISMLNGVAATPNRDTFRTIDPMDMTRYLINVRY